MRKFSPALRPLVLALASLASVAACSAADPTSESVGQSEEELTLPPLVCLPLVGCCIGGGRAWNTSDPFESQMAAFGCQAPQRYSPNGGNWWLWTTCPDPKQQIENYFTAHPAYTKAPYDARWGLLQTAPCSVPALPGSINVVFDPTCPTCSTSFLKLL